MKFDFQKYRYRRENFIKANRLLNSKNPESACAIRRSRGLTQRTKGRKNVRQLDRRFYCYLFYCLQTAPQNNGRFKAADYAFGISGVGESDSRAVAAL